MEDGVEKKRKKIDGKAKKAKDQGVVPTSKRAKVDKKVTDEGPMELLEPEAVVAWRVHLRGLPFGVTHHQVRDFLAPKVPTGDCVVQIAKKNAKASRLKPGELRPGEAEVFLTCTASKAEEIKSLDKAELGGRWIEVQVSHTAVSPPVQAAASVAAAPVGSPARENGQAPGMAGTALRSPALQSDAGGHEIFIKYLPPTATEEEVGSIFSPCGAFMRDPVLLRDGETGDCKGVGWVTFAHEEGLRNALNMDGTAFRGRHLKVARATVRPGAPRGTAQAPGTHTPAMLAQVCDALVNDAHGVYVDATFGRGGHTRGMLERLSSRGRLHAFDVDPTAVAAGRDLERSDTRFKMHHSPFSDMAAVLVDAGPVAGVLLDLGISSPQLDEAARGFRPEQDGPLDLRFDTTKGVPAHEFLGNASREELARIIHEYGGEDTAVAWRIADAVALRQTTGEIPRRTRAFADLVRSAKGRDYQAMHPAKPTFQALRIHLNREFAELREGLAAALQLLGPGGRVGVLTWKHSECAIVMDFLRRHEAVRDDFPLLEVCRREAAARVESLPAVDAVDYLEPLRPTDEELRANSRARSAVFHVLEKRLAPRVVHVESVAYAHLGWELGGQATGSGELDRKSAKRRRTEKKKSKKLKDSSMR